MKIIKTENYNKYKEGQFKLISLKQNIKNKLNKEMYNISRKYYDKIPLQEIFNILKNQNIIVLQEDRTEWSGFLMGEAECGSDNAKNQRANFSLAQKINEDLIPISNAELILTWCKIPSGKYEIIVYIS